MPRPALLGGTVNRHDHLQKTLWDGTDDRLTGARTAQPRSIRPGAQGLEMLHAPLERCAVSLDPVRAPENTSRELVERKRGGMGTARPSLNSGGVQRGRASVHFGRGAGTESLTSEARC